MWVKRVSISRIPYDIKPEWYLREVTSTGQEVLKEKGIYFSFLLEKRERCWFVLVS